MDMSEVSKFEQQKVGKLRLSEAMRIGARMSGPAFGVFMDARGRTCAQGAALLSVGRLHRVEQDRNHDEMESLWPNIDHEIFSKIARMNNSRSHTREQIADWLAAQGL